MSAKEWSQFFDLLAKVVNSEMTWEDKLKMVTESAKELRRELELEEFVSWFGGEAGHP